MEVTLEPITAQRVRDPVCGMEITPEEMTATRTIDGVTYFLCSDNRARKFDADPQRYAAKRAMEHTADVRPITKSIALTVTRRGKAGAHALEQALREVFGVSNATFNVNEGRVFIDYDPARATVRDLLEAVCGEGFTLYGQTLRLKVSGLYCAECVVRIEEALKNTPGVDPTLRHGF